MITLKKISISVFCLCMYSFTISAQEASSQKDGESWVTSSKGSNNYNSIISVNPTFPSVPTDLKGIRMTTGTYYGSAPIDLLPGGDFNVTTGFGGDQNGDASLGGAYGNINMKTNEFNLDVKKINLNTINPNQSIIEINTNNKGLEFDSGSFSFKTDGFAVDSYYAEIKSTNGIALTSSVDITGNLYARNEKSYFRLNTSGQFFMFNTNNNTNTFSEFTVPGLDTSNYKLFIQGGILTEEVRVQTNWADYVFDSQYKLKTLEEVETYINEHGHLPNVPSAKQVEKVGVELGDITRIQQEKIEELTLYTIAQEKKLKTQEERIARLETNNEKLEARLAKIEVLLKKK